MSNARWNSLTMLDLLEDDEDSEVYSHPLNKERVSKRTRNDRKNSCGAEYFLDLQMKEESNAYLKNDESVEFQCSDEKSESTSKSQSVIPPLTQPIARPMALHEFLDFSSYQENVEREWKALYAICERFREKIAYTVPALVGQKHDRMRDVKPNETTRVTLKYSPHPESNGGNYINANFIRRAASDTSGPVYIATQAPTLHSVDEFWTMVQEQNAPIIVMLTKNTDYECGPSAIRRYWPSAGEEPVEFGDSCFIEFLSEASYPEEKYISRSFKLTNSLVNQSRIVTHLQYTGWEDGKIPGSIEEFLEFIRYYRAVREDCGRNAPVIVHCLAGIGRTGTFIAIDMILDQIVSHRVVFKTEPSINVADIVYELRKQRMDMVQKKAQYKFIFDVICHCADYEHNNSLQSIQDVSSSSSRTSRASNSMKRTSQLNSSRASTASEFNFSGNSSAVDIPRSSGGPRSVRMLEISRTLPCNFTYK